jgi:protein-S-isoprenylcysteine O-methyltransferase Ste14
MIAWAGAAAFLAALLYLVYFHIVTLGLMLGNPADRLEHITLNVLLFTAFALHHSLFARPSVKQVVTRILPAGFERSAYVWVASALSVAMCALWQPVAGDVYRVEGALRVLLWVIQGVGAVMALQGARVVNALELAGIPQAAGRKVTEGLQIVGPFRVVRHPIYLGWVLMVFATPTMTADRLLFAIVSTAYLILAIPWEERSLVAGHGDRYREYQRSVRWRLVPGIW